MRYTIDHKTIYTYPEPVSVCHNVLRLAPRDTERQVCKAVRVSIEPKPDSVQEYEDFFGNKVIYFSIEKEHRKLTVVVHSEIEKRVPRGQEMSLEDVGQYVFATPMTAGGPEILDYARVSFRPDRKSVV